ncbi:MAG: hypothetical protein KGL95_11090, partial [Patescibacteria group bacterium]|nr:hypothetical protein [Patescibacteria group bacterium]
SSSRPNGDISVSWKGDSFNSSNGTYSATFHVHNNRSYWIQVNPTWLQNFCTGGSENPCLDNQSVIHQNGVGIQGNNGADITLTTNIYNYLNYHVVNPNCGTYQYDFFFTTNGGEYYGTTDLHTTWAAAMWQTNNGCVAGYPTPTPTPRPTATPTPIPTATPTPQPTNMPTPTPTTPPPHITVVKHVVGGPEHAYDFWMHINNNGFIISFPGNESGVTKAVNPGSFFVYEDQQLGYQESMSGDCRGIIYAGQNLVCYITNTYLYPHVTVIKHVVGGPLQASDFVMHIEDKGGVISFPGNESGTTKAVLVGTYEVTESEYDNYMPSLSGDCQTYAQPGHNYTCTVTNTFIPGVTPTVTPTVIPTDTPTPTNTPTPTPTNTPTATPTPSNNNNCDNSQNNNGGDANNNCNNNNNNQSQNQTQNNNQTVNVTYQVLGTSTASNLPSTGTPLQDLLFLGSMFPAGLFLRRKSK